MAGLGYAGFLAGRPFIGLAAEAVSLGPALAIVRGFALLIAAPAGPALRAAAARPASPAESVAHPAETVATR